MGNFSKDAKNLILGNDGSDKEPLDFKTELQNAIKQGLITKADGTLLITSRTNCDKLAELITKTEEKEVTRASKEDGVEFETLEENKEKKQEKEERERQTKEQEMSLEQQIRASQNEAKAKMASERNLEKQKEIEKNK
ncbi:MAG: hypothetical protein IJ867_06100 [Clostridia bacterium]|nr:hypothetical protein [Clostridia bacterium]